MAVEAGGVIRVVGDYGHGEEVLVNIVRLRPQVVLIGLKWPTPEGLETCREIRGTLPTTKVVMLSSTERQEETLASIMAGASGLVSTIASRNELLRTIQVVASGGSYFDQRVTERVLGRLQEMSSEDSRLAADQGLTHRELAVLTLVAQGHSNAEIAESLYVATSTVRNNITRIRSKLDLDSRAKLVAYAIRHGLLKTQQDEIP